MTASQAKRAYHVQYLLGFEQPDFLRNAFQAILGRDPDLRSHSFFDDRLNRGVMTPVEVLGHIRQSPEGRERGVKIQGLQTRFLLARVLRHAPWLGPMVVSALFSGSEYTRRNFKADAPGRSTGADKKEGLRRRCVLDPAAVASLGFPGVHESPKKASVPGAPPLTEKNREEQPDFTYNREGTRLGTLCTRSYLPFARALINSFHRHHSDIPVVLLVVDLDDGDDSPIDGFGDYVTIVSGRDLDVPKFDYMALKYSATDFCCAMKSYLVSHIIRTTPAARILFMDADIYVFAPLTEMLTKLDSSNFVVIPHTVQPIPNPDRFWEIPTLGDLFYAGVLNAGMFGLTVNEESTAFIDTWMDMVSGPGAFLVGGQMEQNSFNWVTAFVPGVHVLRNKAYNVAYWNIHDRSLRFKGLHEEDGEDCWTVDGQQLVAFHFSGFSPSRPSVISVHDHRYSLYLLPSLGCLLDFYRLQLVENGADDEWDLTYPFNEFPSGVPIDSSMRRIFKEFETDLYSDLSPWSAEGERHYCQALLSPIPRAGSLIPILFKQTYDARLDLQSGYPGADMDPRHFLLWISGHGIFENGYEDLFDRHRPCSPTRDGASSLLSAKKLMPQAFAALERPMGDDRQNLISILREAGHDVLAKRISQLDLDFYRISNISIIRRFLEEDEYLRDRFPDLLYADADAFLAWLKKGGAEENLLTEKVVGTFARSCKGRALARIFSFVNDQWELARSWPLAFVGLGSDDLVRVLLADLKYSRQYDLEDIEMFRWTMAERPWTGVGLTVELLPNLAGNPSTLYREGQEDVLAPVLVNGPEFSEELERYRMAHGPYLRGLRSSGGAAKTGRVNKSPGENDPGSRETNVFQLIHRLGTNDDQLKEPGWKKKRAELGKTKDSKQRITSGVNMFGYFKSPIGLGMMSRGLARALELRNIPVAKNLMGNFALESQIEIADWIGKFQFSYAASIFVTYPHHHELLLRRLPDEMTSGRQNIAYLAWEQRDGNPYWQHVYEGFDQIWALSKFAAEAFQKILHRDVTAVPCAVDFDVFPAPASKQMYGLDPERFTFLYVFDANSSIERKNPEAAIRAFSIAFSTDEPVTLLVKISNPDGLEHRQRLQKMVETAAKTGLDIRFVLEDMPRRNILGLFSAADCYVSLHRAEGFSYTCAEAMAYGKPVIATNYSGNLQFMDHENSYLVDFEEVEVAVPEGPFQRGSVWAEANVEQAAMFMREIYSDIEAAQVIGKRASRDVRRQLSYEAISEIAYKALSQGAR